jgi:hypothetical protein
MHRESRKGNGHMHVDGASLKSKSMELKALKPVSTGHHPSKRFKSDFSPGTCFEIVTTTDIRRIHKTADDWKKLEKASDEEQRKFEMRSTRHKKKHSTEPLCSVPESVIRMEQSRCLMYPILMNSFLMISLQLSGLDVGCAAEESMAERRQRRMLVEC